MSGHGGNIYDFASPGEIIDFSSNINPYGPPSFALEAAMAAMSLIDKYPDPAQDAIRSAFGEWLGADPGKFVFGNGASELISAVCRALAPKRVILTAPTFSDYAASAGMSGIPVMEIPSDAGDGFAFHVEGIKKIFESGDLLIICNPNNPTGRVWERGEILALAGLSRERGGAMMIDECFINLTFPRAWSALSLTDRDNVIVLRALTKDFSAPGLRVGFAVAEKNIISRVRSHMQTWPLNCAGEAFAVACAKNPEPFLAESAAKISIERARLESGLRECGYEVIPSRVNFILARSRADAETLYSELLKHSILIRRCANFPSLGRNYFRVAVKGGPDNDKLLSALAIINGDNR
jgi:threonine-phosphate decarboxylase